jgi:hypothetical protein
VATSFIATGIRTGSVNVEMRGGLRAARRRVNVPEMRELRSVGTPGAVPAVVGALDTVEDVVRWALAQQPSWDVAGVVVQDEYCHDVIVRGPGSAPVFVCFDTT